MTTIGIRVNANLRDAEEGVGGTPLEGNSSDLELGVEYTPNFEQIVGTIYAGCNIPSGVTIDAATVDFVCDEAGSGTGPPLDIYVEESATPADYVNGDDGNISSRSYTTLSQAWQPSESWSVSSVYSSADFAAVLQEAVDDVGGLTDVAVIFDGQAAPIADTRRVAESYNGSSSEAPFLNVTYSVATGRIMGSLAGLGGLAGSGGLAGPGGGLAGD